MKHQQTAQPGESAPKTPPKARGKGNRPRRAYSVLIYQVPSQPSAARVGVWRELKRLGALYLQQSVCILPSSGPLRGALERVATRIAELGGTYHLLPLRSLPPEEEDKIVAAFRAQSTQQYDEIVENCEINFTKEIEFETFRQNFTYAEAEEIRQDLDKIRRWYDRVVERDWFAAPRRADALRWIEHSEALLEAFEEQVFAIQQIEGPETLLPQAGNPPRALRPNRAAARQRLGPAGR